MLPSRQPPPALARGSLLAVAVLSLALLATGAAASQGLDSTSSARELLAVNPSTVFPFCRCQDYSIHNSPFVMNLTAQTSAPGGERLTFRLVRNTLAPKESSVDCRTILLGNLNKIAFLHRPGCEGAAVDIRVNGRDVKPKVRWEEYAGGSLLKLTALRLPNAIGTNISMTLTGACNSRAKFFGSTIRYTFDESNRHVCCPSGNIQSAQPPPMAPQPDESNVFTPPPPPSPRPDAPRPPSKFPFCNCKRRAGGYSLDLINTTTAPGGMTTWTFRVEEVSGNTWPLAKIEFWLKDAARSKIRDITVNNQPYSRSETFYAQGRVAFKITPLNLQPGRIGGTVVKFSAPAPFKTLNDLFVDNVTYSLFSARSSKSYCPTYQLL